MYDNAAWVSSLESYSGFLRFGQSSSSKTSSWRHEKQILRTEVPKKTDNSPSRLSSIISSFSSLLSHTIHCRAGLTSVSVQVLHVTWPHFFEPVTFEGTDEKYSCKSESNSRTEKENIIGEAFLAWRANGFALGLLRCRVGWSWRCWAGTRSRQWRRGIHCKVYGYQVL